MTPVCYNAVTIRLGFSIIIVRAEGRLEFDSRYAAERKNTCACLPRVELLWYEARRHQQLQVEKLDQAGKVAGTSLADP